jgi:hypothetical protein
MDASGHKLTLMSRLGLACSGLSIICDAWFYSVTKIGVVRKALLQCSFYDDTVLLEDLVPSATGLCLVCSVWLKAFSTGCRIGILFGLILE